MIDLIDFSQRGKKKRSLLANPKKNFNPLDKWDKKPLPLIDFALFLEEVVPNNRLFTAAPKPKIGIVREVITDWAGETDVEVTSIESLMKLSKIKAKFLGNLNILLIEIIRQIERNNFWNDICQSKYPSSKI